MVAGLLMEWEWQRDVQNPLAADQGNTFPEQFLCVWRGEMYPVGPAGRCVTWRWNIPEVDNERVSLGLGSAGSAVG